MKTGKYIPLGVYKNVKIGYGTVDFKNLKTIYLKLNSWVQPEDLNEDDDDVDFNYLITKSRRLIKELIYNLQNENYKPQSIVDLDIRTKGIKQEKRSFMNLEITLYVENKIDIKSKDTKKDIKELMETVIDKGLSDKNLYNFYKTKK
jgi:hypothetical protein